MFIAKNKVRMHDTDMAGILYFPRQFRFVHDALEDFLESFGLTFEKVFNAHDFVFVIAHCEADYILPVYVGDQLEVHLKTGHIGGASFSILYEIYRGEALVGTAKTVHVTLARTTRKKIPIPPILKEILKNNE